MLGIDPGTRITGWGVVEPAGAQFRRVASGVVALPARRAIAERLHRIHEAVAQLIAEYRPDAVALERAFLARNVQSAFRLGEARGAVLIAAAAAGVPVFEYAPAQVKLSVVGYGRAEKAQIVRGVALRFGTVPSAQFDEADALALALCHLIGSRLQTLVAAGRVRSATS